MAPNIDIPLALIKTAAVSGIGLVLANFTVKAFQFARHIFLTLPEEETLPKKHSFHCNYCGRFFQSDDNSMRWVLCQAIYVCDDCAKKGVVCEKCQERFLDDGEELEQDMFF